MKKKKILSIETSCDETSIAIIENKKVISLITNTQIDTFKKYGGVIPELSSRMHVDNITYVYEACLEKANLTIKDIDYIAVTKGPGLVGSLLVGINFAKVLSKIHNIPLVGVNHLIGHINAINIESEIEYPHLSLITSGGHTELIYICEKGNYKKIGKTLDDAAGESFDKVARILNIGYPGGPEIDKLAKLGNDNYKLPIPKTNNDLDFSFSGLKSAAFNLNNTYKMKGKEIIKEDFANSFQNRVTDYLVDNLLIANNRLQPKQLSVVGGVSANSMLREKINKTFDNVLIPNNIYSTDNAAMIGFAAIELIESKNFELLNDLNAVPNLEIKE